MDHLSSAPLHSPETLPSPMKGSELHAPGSVVRDAADGSPQFFMGDFAEATRDLLMEDSTAKRAAAAHRLAMLGRPLASPYLIAALADDSPEVRLAAVHLICKESFFVSTVLVIL